MASPKNGLGDAANDALGYAEIGLTGYFTLEVAVKVRPPRADGG